MKRVLYPLCFLIAVLSTHHASSQGFLKKLKDKVNKTVDNAVDKKTGTAPAGESGGSGGTVLMRAHTLHCVGTVTCTGGQGGPAGMLCFWKYAVCK